MRRVGEVAERLHNFQISVQTAPSLRFEQSSTGMGACQPRDIDPRSLSPYSISGRNFASSGMDTSSMPELLSRLRK